MSKKIILKSSDGELFKVDEAVSIESQTIKHMIKDNCADNIISLPNVTGVILAKVIEYCQKYVEAAAKANADDKDVYSSTENEELKTWDTKFAKVDQPTLFDLILAADYLKISGLLDLMCQTVANMMKGKTPEEMRAHFNIKNDYSPEEERRSAIRTDGHSSDWLWIGIRTSY